MKVTTPIQISVFAFIFASNVSAIPAIPIQNDKGLFERESACIALSTCPGMNPGPDGKPNNPSPLPSSPPRPSTSSPPPSSPSPTDTPVPNPPITIQRAAMKIYTYSCNKEQKAAVQTAWDEAAVLADAHSKWESPGWFGIGAKYEAAMDTYIGTDSKKDKPLLFGTGPLKSNVLRQRGIHYTDEDWSPSWSYAYFYCDETTVPDKPDKPKSPQCNKPNQKGKKVVAYTFPDDGTLLWNAKYVVLCPRFFDKDITTLEAKVAQAKENPDMQKTMSDLWRKVKARVLFHESYHWGKAEVSDPRCNRSPEVYDPSKVVKLALDENVKGAGLNGETIPPLPISLSRTNILSPLLIFSLFPSFTSFHSQSIRNQTPFPLLLHFSLPNLSAIRHPRLLISMLIPIPPCSRIVEPSSSGNLPPTDLQTVLAPKASIRGRNL